jgi:N utilization substance protein B
MTTRRRAREVVLQVLYEDDLNPTHDTKISDQFLCSRLLNRKVLVTFARELLEGVRENRSKLDEILSRHSSNWSIKRMAALDRNILRLATYEMAISGVPGRVAINEAVDLAKRYGDKNSGAFVNGLLDRVYRDICQTETVPSDPEATTTESESNPAE